MSKPKRIKQTKKPIDILKNRIISDSNIVILFAEDKLIKNNLFNAVTTLLQVCDNRVLGEDDIENINAQIGIFTDIVKEIDTEYKKLFWIIGSYITSYQDYCNNNDLKTIADNFQKLIEHKPENAIYE